MRNNRLEFYMIEPITLIPSSLLNVPWRAIKQFFLPTTWYEQLAEISVQKRVARSALDMLFKLTVVPLLISFLATFFIFKPVVYELWHNHQSDIFLHDYLEKKAFKEYEKYADEVYFDFFLNPHLYTEEFYIKQRQTLDYCVRHKGTCPPLELSESKVEAKLRDKMRQLAGKYSQESVDTLVRLLGDSLTLVVFFGVVYTSGSQLFLLKAVILELLSSLHDITRSLMLIFFVNLVVGYHSPRGWELILQILIDRGNWPLGETFILFVVGTLPVIIDTCLKYWIFRYLNKSLPTTVVTYHRMIE